MNTEPSLQSTVLPCGLRANHLVLPYGKLFTATLHVRGGSHNDPLGKAGLAHFTEHMAFEGMNQEISEQLSEEGVHINGFTGNEYTLFEVRGHVDFLDSALQFFANIFKKSRTYEATFFREQEVIQQEIEDAEPESLHKRTLSFIQYRARVARNPNWKQTILGSKKSLTKIQPEDIDEFRRDHYLTKNAVLSIVASSSTKDFPEKLSKVFEDNESGSQTILKTLGDSNNDLPRFSYSYDRFPTIWIGVDYAISRTDTAARSAADIISHHFGGGSHSEMFKRFRKDTGNAYNATSYHYSHLGHLTLSNFVSTTKKHLADALGFLLDRMATIRDEGLTQEQLDAHVVRFNRWSQMIVDQPDRLVCYSGYEALRSLENQLVDPVQVAEAIRSLSLEEVQKATREILAPENRTVFVGGRVGPVARHRIRKIIARNS